MTNQQLFDTYAAIIFGLFLIWLGVALLVVGLLLRPVGQPTPYIVASGAVLCIVGWRLWR